jgi:hypothetical protein
MVLFFLFLFSSCQKELGSNEIELTYNLNVHFSAVVDTARFGFGKTYKNTFGEPFSVRAFKFYISEIDLINDEAAKTVAIDRSQYFLVDFSKASSTTLKLKTQTGNYNRIGFVIGVDSLHNVSGAQSGALDPANGMFWTWNSGYIMAKLEGTSPLSNQPNNLFEYHIGGFKREDNVVQKVYPPFPSGKRLITEAGKFSDIIITADINKWFSGIQDISIAAVPVCMTPGPLSQKIAANYNQMFSVQEIINQ